MSSVPVFAAIATIHEEEEDGGDIEELNRPDDGQTPWPWMMAMTPHGNLSQDLLRARSREAPTPASELDAWLEARDPGPSDLVLLRCPRRGLCNTCQNSEFSLCRVGQAHLCRACQQGDPFYCKQGGPCERWNQMKVQEYSRRREFYMLPPSTRGLSQTCRGPQLPLGQNQPATPSFVQGLETWVRNFGRPKKSASLPPSTFPLPTYRQTERGRLSRTLTESVFPSSRQNVEEDQKKPLLGETIFGRSQDSSKTQPRQYMHPFPANQSHISRRRSELRDNQSTMVEPGSYESFARVLPGRREQGTPVNRQSDAVPPTQHSPRQETTVRFEDDPRQASELMSDLLQGLEQLRMNRSKSTHPLQPEGNVTQDRPHSSQAGAASSSLDHPLDHLLRPTQSTQAGAGSSVSQPEGPLPDQEQDQGDDDSSSGSEDDRRRRHRSGGGGGGGGGEGGGLGGGGRGGGGGGDGWGGGDPGNIGRRQDGDRRRRPRGHEPDVSIPLGLIVDRLASMDARMSGDKTKQKPINLPSPTREPDGKIKTISFYKWMHLLSRMVDDLSLDHSNVQIQLASDTKILPPQLREIVYDSSSLSQALRRLQRRFPPLSSTWPILISELTSKAPTGGQHTEVIERCADLLSSISALQSLHPHRDLNREETLAALASLGSTTELQSGMVRLVREFDYAKNLHQDDPGYSNYVSNLKKYLEEERETRQDILASVALGVRMAPEWSSNVQSFASQAKPVVQLQRKRNRGPPTGQKGNNDNQNGDNAGYNGGGADQKKQERPQAAPPGTTTNNQRNARAAKTCSLCQKGNHLPFQCSKIKDIQSKKMPKPDNLCLLCCHWTKSDVPHQPNCFLKSFINKDGVTKRLNLLCSTHQSTHYALCVSCDAGEITKPRVADSPTVQGFQVQMGKTNLRPNLGGPTEIPQVVFMSEVLTIQGKDGTTCRVIAHYDSLSGANFSSDIPENFNWGEKGALTEPFSLMTMTGKEEYSLPVIGLKIQGRGKNPIEASFLVNNYPEIEDTFIFPDLLKECGVNSLSQEERQIPLRIMFGVPNSQNFPVTLPTSRKLASRFPFLSLHQSRITGAKLVSGRISPVDPKRGVLSFMGKLSTSVHQPTSRKKKEEGSKCSVNQD